MLVKIRAFGGIAPKLNPRYLPDERAQTALNVDTTRQGALLPISDAGPDRRTLPFVPKKLFRTNLDYFSSNLATYESAYWIASPNDASFCRGQIIDDDNEIIYVSIDENNGANSGSKLPPLMGVTGGADLPPAVDATPDLTTGIVGIDRFYGLGVPAPTTALSVTPQNVPEDVDGLSREFRSYVYTYVWKVAGREMESRPSPPSTSEGIYLESGSFLRLSGFQNPEYPTNYGVASGVTTPLGMNFSDVSIRIYRSVGGEFLLVNSSDDISIGGAPANIGNYDDNVASEDLGEPIPSNTWNLPPRRLRFLTNMSNGIIAGAVGKNVYFCEPYIPHAWPIAYSVSVDAPIVGMAALDTTLVVLTKERPYFIQGSSPDFMTVVQADANQSCVSERSIATMNGEVYFASPDGLLATSPRGTRNVTEQLFSYRQWNETFNVPSIHGYTQDQKYFGFHDAGSFIYDLPTGQFVTTDVQAHAAYEDKRQDKLFYSKKVSNSPIAAWGDGDNKRATWKSKVFGMPSEVSFGFIQLEAEDYFDDTGLAEGDIPTDADTRLTVWADGVLFCQYRMYKTRYKILQFPDGTLNTFTSTPLVPFRDRNIMRLPSKLARDWEFQVETDYEVFNIVMAQSGEEMAGA